MDAHKAFAVGMMFKKSGPKKIVYIVQCVIVDGEEGDNKHDVIARAQKYVDANRADQVDGFKLEAYDITYFELSD